MKHIIWVCFISMSWIGAYPHLPPQVLKQRQEADLQTQAAAQQQLQEREQLQERLEALHSSLARLQGEKEGLQGDTQALLFELSYTVSVPAQDH